MAIYKYTIGSTDTAVNLSDTSYSSSNNEDNAQFSARFNLDSAWFNADGSINTGQATAENIYNAQNTDGTSNDAFVQMEYYNPSGPSGSVDLDKHYYSVNGTGTAGYVKYDFSSGEITLTGNRANGYDFKFLDSGSGASAFNVHFSGTPTGNGSGYSFGSGLSIDNSRSYIDQDGQSIRYFEKDNIINCFAKGTLITTASGLVSVEDLQVGDHILTVSGKYEPITWLGHSRVNCLRHNNPAAAWPVRIAKDAFGPDLPARDLLVSPAHAIYVEGHFVSAASLINGVTISQEPWSKVTYFHVELPTHNAIYAEGLAAESYLDADNREFFLETDVVALDSQFSEVTPEEVYATKGYAPLASTGAVFESVRTKLLNRITELGHQLNDDPKLELIVDGAPLEVLRTPVGLVAWIPEGAKTMTLRSNSFVPGYVYASSFDDRHLGVSVTGMRLGTKAIDLKSGALQTGWHDAETTFEADDSNQAAFSWRWTDGQATIALEQSGCLFEITTQAAAKVYWQAKDGQFVQVKTPGMQELRYAA